MIILDPVTFKQTKIDINKITQDQGEYLKKLTKITKKILKLQQEQFLIISKIELEKDMRFRDVLKKISL